MSLKLTLDNKAKYLIINIMTFQLSLVYHFIEMDISSLGRFGD